MMWASSLRREQSYRDEDGPRWPMHNIDDRMAALVIQEGIPEPGTTAVATPQDGLQSRSEGTWGERDVGGPVNRTMYWTIPIPF